jgi:N-acetylglucosamine kinase-like BadF-type ATPase
MRPPRNDPSATAVGLDIGGSKTHGILIRDGEPCAEATVGSANVQNITPATAAAHLADLFMALGAEDVSRVVAGAGGVDTEADRKALEQLIRPLAPHADITVVHDSRLILAAGGESTGIAVISGTGSVAWGRNTRGEEARSGGWGYLLGDEGSGYWLGREAVRHSLRRMDDSRAPDALTRRLLEDCELAHPGELISHFHSPATGRHYWAQRAGTVIESAGRGHRASQELLVRAGEDLAALAQSVAHRLGIAGPVVLGGGLGMNVRPIQEVFAAKLASAGLEAIRILDQPPVHGARILMQTVQRTA